jgi:curved DNA-binding protein CbpA
LTSESSRFPRLLPGTDLRALPLSPAEAFVVSRVDGSTSSADIAEQTGKSEADVSLLLERLASLGALVFDDPPPQSRRAQPAPARRMSGVVRAGPIVEASASVDVRHPAASLYDPAELDEPVDIELPRRRQILDLYYRLDQLTHYQVFGVAVDADKKAIKEAYFEVVNLFHPDRYFGKNVGSFRPKLERVFARLTESYDVLSRKHSRAEYDAYLAAQSRTRAFDAGERESDAHQATLREVMRRIQAEASRDNRVRSVPPPAPITLPPLPDMQATEQLSPPSAELPPSSLRAPLRPSSLRPSDPEARRRALARKLGRSPDSGREGRAAAPPQAAEPSHSSSQRQEWAADELKRRYQDAVQAARERQVEAYTRAARVALEKGDHVGASNALRIAVSLAPQDTKLTEQLNEVSAKAKHELSESYLAQAEYEERDEKWLPAAKSYSRALAGRPEPRLFEKLAHCLLSGGGDLREAGDAAKKAVLMQPENARFRVTLAHFYVKAGLKQSAEGELSRAATLAPSDDKVADWIRRLKRELG